jgi:hypothetical protein
MFLGQRTVLPGGERLMLQRDPGGVTDIAVGALQVLPDGVERLGIRRAVESLELVPRVAQQLPEGLLLTKRLSRRLFRG